MEDYVRIIEEAKRSLERGEARDTRCWAVNDFYVMHMGNWWWLFLAPDGTRLRLNDDGTLQQHSLYGEPDELYWAMAVYGWEGSVEPIENTDEVYVAYYKEISK